MKRYTEYKHGQFLVTPNGPWVRAVEAVRVEEQRNRAWHTLSQMEALLTGNNPSIAGLCFLLAGARKPGDAEEYHEVIATTTPETTWTDESDAAKAAGGK